MDLKLIELLEAARKIGVAKLKVGNMEVEFRAEPTSPVYQLDTAETEGLDELDGKARQEAEEQKRDELLYYSS